MCWSAIERGGINVRSKSSIVFVLSSLLSAVSNNWSACGQEHMLRTGEYVVAGGVALDVGDHAIPCVCDWNNDGRKDLVVGYRYEDKVALFLNQGSDTQPEFTDYANIQADGVDIQHSSEGCGAPAPWVCDYDSDGIKDLLVGTGKEGFVVFYQNTNTDDDPVLAGGISLKAGGTTLSVSARATPYVHDWDEDGLNDLMCGAADGNVYFFKNAGTAQAPSYAGALLIQAGGSPVRFGYRSAIRVCDWDGDDLKDLVASGSNNASWCRNVGTNSAPVLEAPRRLQCPAEGIGLANIDTGYRMRLEVIDWNRDNVNDLLIGTHDGRLLYYEGYEFAVNRVELEDSGQIVIKWNSADYLSYDILAGEALDELNPVAANLSSGGKTTSWCAGIHGNMTFFRVELAE